MGLSISIHFNAITSENRRAFNYLKVKKQHNNVKKIRGYIYEENKFNAIIYDFVTYWLC
jgi:hypothetical protein